jgi:DNA-binding NtrC family response regulator
VKPQILMVDDDPAIRLWFCRYLTDAGFTVYETSCLKEARETILTRRFDALLLDLNLPDGNGLDWIPELRENYPELPIIVISGEGDIPKAVEAMRRGADNFLAKPVEMAGLQVFLQKALEWGSLRRQRTVKERLDCQDTIFWGSSPGMTRVKELASLAAENDSTVLLLGETGTGKGMLAKWIHQNSQCGSEPLVEVNCSGLKGALLASELFGVVRGAFTSALQNRQGLIEIADRGTLFLDEIGDMDLEVQAQFLKVIEDKWFRRVGDVKIRHSDFRLLCATNKNLGEEIAQQRFRKDLFFRIQVFPIQIPPLRERPEDLEGLVSHLLVSLVKADVEVPAEIIKLLKEYPWPGNIRELRNILERACLLSRGRPRSVEHFPGLLRTEPFPSPRPSQGDSYGSEESAILAALKEHQGHVAQTAKALGMSRATLYRKLQIIKDRPV